MKPEALETQHDLDPTTPAIAVEQIKFPIAVVSSSGTFRWLVISERKEIAISNWVVGTSSGLDKLRDETGIEIPATDLIAELETILADLKSKL